MGTILAVRSTKQRCRRVCYWIRVTLHSQKFCQKCVMHIALMTAQTIVRPESMLGVRHWHIGSYRSLVSDGVAAWRTRRTSDIYVGHNAWSKLESALKARYVAAYQAARVL